MTGLQVRWWKWNEARTGQARALSPEGLFMQTDQLVGEGTRVTLRLELPGLPGMTVLGQVVRTVRGGLVAAAGLGIRFLDLSPTQRRAIADYAALRMLPEGA